MYNSSVKVLEKVCKKTSKSQLSLGKFLLKKEIEKVLPKILPTQYTNFTHSYFTFSNQLNRLLSTQSTSTTITTKFK